MLRGFSGVFSTGMSSVLASIPNVDIDPQGVFKYILIQVRVLVDASG
jgi:hypothetical protein